ncbi:unnamed protein product [Dibothriocephalus latus]|uniref:G-protein coupled receptors family 1 profile domain-containing protein n=1 Tax=Dibothriocephalus latus TaxID=60516 RepID=A0A3P7LJC9_DIBLA|nr:unnamed protein product [Dibothriocephalus latus]
MEPAYWECPKSDTTGDAISKLIAFICFLSLFLGLGLLIILCFLKSYTRTYLIHLRAITASTVLCSIIGFCHHTIPARIGPNDYILGRIVCHVWRSLYLFDVCYIFGALNLVFMVGHRAIQIAEKYQNSFAPSMFSDVTCLIIIGVSSILSVLSQAFVVLFDGNYCFCRETDIPYIVLVCAYVGSFVRFGLAVIISPIFLCFSCYKIIQWVRNTPAEKLWDTWNCLTFPGTTDRQIKELRRPRGWMTASMCTVPLSANFVACSLYGNIYQFLCAAGLGKMKLGSLTYRAGIVLLYLQLFFSPIIIAVYIPALWDPFVLGARRMPSILFKKVRTLVAEDAGDLQIP